MSFSPEPGSVEAGPHRLPSAEAVPGEVHPSLYPSATSAVHFVSSPSNSQSHAISPTSYPSHPHVDPYAEPSTVSADPYAEFAPPTVHNPLTPPRNAGAVDSSRRGRSAEDVDDDVKEGGGEEVVPGSVAPSASASLPLPLLVSSVMATPPSPPPPADSSYASHRPEPILTSHLSRVAAVPGPAHLETLEALASSELPSLPPLPPLPSAPPAELQPAVEAEYPSVPSILPRLPTYAVSMGKEEEGDEEEVVPGAAGDEREETPPPVINIHYAEDAEEEVGQRPMESSGPIGGLATQSVASYDYGEEEEKKVHEEHGYGLGVTAASAITATTVPYHMSSGTFIPHNADDGLNHTSRFTTYGGSSHYALDGDGLGAIASSIGSTTTPSPLPYNTASSLVLLSPPGGDATISPSAHSTPLHLRPSFRSVSVLPSTRGCERDDEERHQCAVVWGGG